MPQSNNCNPINDFSSAFQHQQRVAACAKKSDPSHRDKSRNEKHKSKDNNHLSSAALYEDSNFGYSKILSDPAGAAKMIARMNNKGKGLSESKQQNGEGVSKDDKVLD